MEPVVQISSQDQCWEVLAAGPGFHLGFQSDSQIENHHVCMAFGENQAENRLSGSLKSKNHFSMIFEKKTETWVPMWVEPGSSSQPNRL
jgi:hypothetical protein